MAAGNGFPRHVRLLKPVEFSSVFSRRCSRRGDFVQVYVRSASLAHPRLGLVVAKRDVARSVDRNYARRIIRESFRLQMAVLPPLDYVVRVLRVIRPPEAVLMRAELARFLARPKSCPEL